MKSGHKTLNTARQNFSKAAVSVNTARPINTAYLRPIMNSARTVSNVFNRAHSHVRRPFNKFTTNKNSNLNEKVNTVRRNVTTVGSKAVVSDNKGNEANAIKASACWVWRPKKKVLDYGNPQLELQEKGVIDSGCSNHMTGNKSHLSDYEEIDGGLVAFRGDPKGGKITGKGKINTGCYLSSLNNKHPYELFLVKTCLKLHDNHMGCPVTILNTIDHLGKFDRKVDKGFFIGYSTNSKAFRIFNSRTRIVKENMHIKFSEETSNIAGNGPNWLFNIDALTKSMNYEIVVAGNQSNGITGIKACENVGKVDYSKDSPDLGFKPSGEEEKKDDEQLENKDSEVPNTNEPRVNQEQYENINSTNSTNNINIVSSTVNIASIMDNAIDENTIYRCVDDPNMPNLEEIVYLEDDEGVGAEADMNNLDTLMPDENAEDVDVHLYRSMIGSLMYLTSSRPNIMFIVCACARLQVTPKVSHLHAVKRIFRYLKGQPKLGLWFPKDSPFDLEAYTDRDYAGASLDRKSTIGVANSTTEAEYVAASSYCGQIDDWNGLEMLRTKLGLKPFWSTAKIKIVNNERQICAKVNGKTIVISESSVRRDLQFNDEDDEIVHEERGDNMERAATTATSLDAEQDSGVNTPGSGEDRLKIMELMEICTKLSDRGRYDLDTDVTTASAPITTDGVFVCTAKLSTPSTTTTLIEDEDLTIAQTLMKMRKPSESGTRKAVPPSQYDLKDKGKAKMIEPEKPLKKKDQIKFDKEVAKRIAEELEAELEEEEERVARQREDEANLISWDNTQAMMEADYELAQRLQAEERGELTIEERSRLFVELMDKWKKHFVKLRAEMIRRKPITKAQKRNQMSTYLRNIAGYKHTQLKNKSFEEIQMLIDKEMKRVNSFIPMDSEVVEGNGKKTESSRKETVSKKRAEIVPRDDEAVNVELLSTKYLIVDWKTHILAEDKMYYQIIRADGSEKYYKIFSAMLDDFDRQDVLDLYRLVKERFETASPEGYDRLLWGDLITLFEPSEEDEIWKAQQDYTLISWRLFDSCGIHLLLTDTGITIHMLVERKYPLTQEMLSRMLSRRLEVDHECEMAYELLRFTRSQLKK
ncbi:hypothetical protein Tco_0331694 [Tanacetum coccineum]